MPGNTRAPRNRAPDLEDFEPVIEQQAQEIDSQLGQAGPTGTYSAQKLAAFATEVDAVMKLMDPALPPTEGLLDVEDGPLSLELVKRYGAIVLAESQFAESEGEPATLPDLESLTNDAAIGAAMGRLRVLSKDRDFKRFLKEEAPEAEVEEAVEEPGSQGAEFPDSGGNPEIDFLR